MELSKELIISIVKSRLEEKGRRVNGYIGDFPFLAYKSLCALPDKAGSYEHNLYRYGMNVNTISVPYFKKSRMLPISDFRYVTKVMLCIDENDTEKFGKLFVVTDRFAKYKDLGDDKLLNGIEVEKVFTIEEFSDKYPSALNELIFYLN